MTQTHLYALLCFIIYVCVQQICIWNFAKQMRYIWTDVACMNISLVQRTKEVLTINQNTFPGLWDFSGQGGFANPLPQRMQQNWYGNTTAGIIKGLLKYRCLGDLVAALSIMSMFG